MQGTLKLTSSNYIYFLEISVSNSSSSSDMILIWYAMLMAQNHVPRRPVAAIDSIYCNDKSVSLRGSPLPTLMASNLKDASSLSKIVCTIQWKSLNLSLLKSSTALTTCIVKFQVRFRRVSIPLVPVSFMTSFSAPKLNWRPELPALFVCSCCHRFSGFIGPAPRLGCLSPITIKSHINQKMQVNKQRKFAVFAGSIYNWGTLFDT